MFVLLIIWSLLESRSAFRFGFFRVLPAVNRKSISERFAEPTAPSFSSEDMENEDLCSALDTARSDVLVATQMVVDATVYPAIDNSPFIVEKYPNPLNRTVQNILGGLSDVVDIEYLSTLPTNDPRVHFLSTIADPGPERRAELNENLQAIDAERGEAAKNASTLSVYQTLSRKGFGYAMLNTFAIAVMAETKRRSRPEFSEYGRSDLCINELVEFTTKYLVEHDSEIVCNHPNMSAYFSFYNVSIFKLDEMRDVNSMLRDIPDRYFADVIYPVIYDSPIIAEKYPNPADRTPHKLLGGLANIVSIEYMQSLEPHDPRRLFLDTLTAPDEQRCIELERNAVLVDKAVKEGLKENAHAERIPLRALVLFVVRNGLEEVYLTWLKAAQLSEQMRRYAKNNGGEGADPEGDAYRETLVGGPIKSG